MSFNASCPFGYRTHSQETQAENAYEQVPLLLGHLQLPERRQREGKHGDIGDDVAGGVDIPLRDVGDALGVSRGIPEAVDRGADEDADEHLRQGPAANDGHGDNVDDAHVLHSEDAVVLEEESELDEEQRGAVEDDGEVKVLVTSGSVFA